MKTILAPLLTDRFQISPEIAEKLEVSVISFSNVSRLPITFYDTSCAVMWEHLKEQKICSLLPVYDDMESPCRKNILSSSKIASQLGEAYVFVCSSGLANIAMPLILKGRLCGFFIAGPILMGELKESLISKVLDMNHLSGNPLSLVVLFLRQMKGYIPKDISFLSTLFEAAVLSPISSNADYSKLNAQCREQRTVGETLQKQKREHRMICYPHKMERELIESVKGGGVSETTSKFNEYFDALTISESGILSSIKTKILGLCISLDNSTAKSEFHLSVMDDLNETKTMGELHDLAAEIITKLTLSMAPVSYDGKSYIVQSTLDYVSKNYSTKLQMKTAAALLHTNPSYLSSLFKRETGLTFSEYVNQLRINKSKELLQSSNLSLSQIAEMTGFEDQSYFSKKFKQLTGVTPKAYRKDANPV